MNKAKIALIASAAALTTVASIGYTWAMTGTYPSSLPSWVLMIIQMMWIPAATCLFVLSVIWFKTWSNWAKWVFGSMIILITVAAVLAATGHLQINQVGKIDSEWKFSIPCGLTCSSTPLPASTATPIATVVAPSATPLATATIAAPAATLAPTATIVHTSTPAPTATFVAPSATLTATIAPVGTPIGTVTP